MKTTLDVVGNDSVRALNEILKSVPQLVSEDKANGGWAFAKVTVDDANGKPIQVDKILNPFNLL